MKHLLDINQLSTADCLALIKGETIADTIQTLAAMGIQLFSYVISKMDCLKLW